MVQLYYVHVQTLAQAVLEYIRKHELLKAGDRVSAAVSGGADSVAMVRLLLELRAEIGVVLSVAHFNHQLRGAESDADERFVAELAQRHKLELRCERGDVAAYAAEKHLSLETAGREMRYEFFRRLLLQGQVNRIATAHTLDDQAETVLLRIVRGAGSRGLAGIYPQLSVVSSQFSENAQRSALSIQPQPASIIRPLLGTRRKDLETYLGALGQGWQEDKSNRDLRHARNRIRHGILPRLERNLNPAVREALAETAEIARAEEEYFESEVARVLALAWKFAEGRHYDRRDAGATSGIMRIADLANLPLALRRRVVRAAGESLGLRLVFRHVEEVLALLPPGCARSTVLPDGWRVSRNKRELRFECGSMATKESDYEYCLSVPGSVDVRELGSRFEAVLIEGSTAGVYNPEHLLNRKLLAGELRVRNWRPGDRFWPAHTKAPKKIKELLQERHVAGPGRKQWPVVVSGSDLVWMRGFPVPARWRSGDGAAVAIREMPLQEGVDLRE